MHPKTYEILEFDSLEQGRAAGFTAVLYGAYEDTETQRQSEVAAMETGAWKF